MSTKKLIQKIEINKNYDHPIHCLFCGQKVCDLSSSNETDLCNPCEHTLFVACDEGLVFVKPELESQLSEDILYDGDMCMDELTDKVVYEDSVKVASYTPMPSGMGAYIGFSPEKI